jgi:DNA-binding HxlR family transcriptional regulator
LGTRYPVSWSVGCATTGPASRPPEVTISTAPTPKRHPYDQWAPDARALDLVGDKWTLLIVRDLAAGPRRFVELQRVLPGISTEQLRSRLNRMVADGLLTRQRYREVPPRVDYELTERAQELMPIIGELARWGYSWAWGSPRGGEAIDVGAILRTAPGLLHLPRNLKGTLEIVVTDCVKDGEDRHYQLIADGGSVSIREEPASEPDARVTATERAWVDSFGPDPDHSGLKTSGNQRLAETLLDSLAPHGASNTAAA